MLSPGSRTAPLEPEAGLEWATPAIRHLSTEPQRKDAPFAGSGFPVIERDFLFAPPARKRIRSDQQHMLAVRYLHLPIPPARNNCQCSRGRRGAVDTDDYAFKIAGRRSTRNITHLLLRLRSSSPFLSEQSAGIGPSFSGPSPGFVVCASANRGLEFQSLLKPFSGPRRYPRAARPG